MRLDCRLVLPLIVLLSCDTRPAPLDNGANDSDVSAQPTTQLIQLSYTGSISEDGPVLLIALLPKPASSNYHYALEVRTERGMLLQSMGVRNGVPVGTDDFVVEDINADGHKDIRLLGGTDTAGAPWYKSWLN